MDEKIEKIYPAESSVDDEKFTITQKYRTLSSTGGTPKRKIPPGYEGSKIDPSLPRTPQP